VVVSLAAGAPPAVGPSSGCGPRSRHGIGLAVALLIDATLVRGVLLPASMALLGERTWRLPRWLHRLPASSH
jgi:uncharacterized membrane protein YdfJ with MMPL/SSD domain